LVAQRALPFIREDEKEEHRRCDRPQYEKPDEDRAEQHCFEHVLSS
jgi:hypothetical protein